MFQWFFTVYVCYVRFFHSNVNLITFPSKALTSISARCHWGTPATRFIPSIGFIGIEYLVSKCLQVVRQMVCLGRVETLTVPKRNLIWSKPGISSWWFQPLWKICSSKWESSPNRGENKKYLKPPPRFEVVKFQKDGEDALPKFGT